MAQRAICPPAPRTSTFVILELSCRGYFNVLVERRREYSRVTRSLPAVRWSRGLRAAMLGPASDPERPGNDLAAEDIGGSLLAVIQFPAWSRIRAAGLEHALLVAAEKGGLTAVNGLIAQVTGSPALPMPETRPACPGPGVR
jgi:hypothetical protein